MTLPESFTVKQIAELLEWSESSVRAWLQESGIRTDSKGQGSRIEVPLSALLARFPDALGESSQNNAHMDMDNGDDGRAWRAIAMTASDATESRSPESRGFFKIRQDGLCPGGYLHAGDAADAFLRDNDPLYPIPKGRPRKTT